MLLYAYVGATTATEGIQATSDKQKIILSEINKEIKEDEKEIFVRKKYRDMYVHDVLTEKERTTYNSNVMHGLLCMINDGNQVVYDDYEIDKNISNHPYYINQIVQNHHKNGTFISEDKIKNENENIDFGGIKGVHESALSSNGCMRGGGHIEVLRTISILMKSQCSYLIQICMKIIYTVLKANPLNIVCLEGMDVVDGIYCTLGRLAEEVCGSQNHDNDRRTKGRLSIDINKKTENLYPPSIINPNLNLHPISYLDPTPDPNSLLKLTPDPPRTPLLNPKGVYGCTDITPVIYMNRCICIDLDVYVDVNIYVYVLTFAYLIIYEHVHVHVYSCTYFYYYHYDYHHHHYYHHYYSGDQRPHRLSSIHIHSYFLARFKRPSLLHSISSLPIIIPLLIILSFLALILQRTFYQRTFYQRTF